MTPLRTLRFVLPLLGAALAPGRALGQASFVDVTDAERNGLEISARAIWHPMLGFALPHPGRDFHRNPDLEGRVGSPQTRRFMVAWGFAREGPDNVLVQVFKVAGVDRSFFMDLADGFREPARARPGFGDVLYDKVTWSDSLGDFRYSVHHVSGLYAKTRCMAKGATGVGVVVCVVTTSQQADALDFVRAGLSLKVDTVFVIATAPNQVFLEAVVEQRPELLGGLPPEYPDHLRQAGVQGRVMVQMIVDTLGRAEPASIRVVLTPHPDFAQSAIQYCLHARFRPARVKGRAVRVLVNVPLDYKIKGRRGVP